MTTAVPSEGAPAAQPWSVPPQQQAVPPQPQPPVPPQQQQAVPPQQQPPFPGQPWQPAPRPASQGTILRRWPVWAQNTALIVGAVAVLALVFLAGFFTAQAVDGGGARPGFGTNQNFDPRQFGNNGGSGTGGSGGTGFGQQGDTSGQSGSGS